MTQATVQQPVADPLNASIELPETLEQENARLRRQLGDLHARLDQLVDERLADWIALHESDLQIHARLDAENVLNAVLDWAMLVTAAVAGALYLVVEPVPPTQAPRTLRVVAQRGYWPEIAQDEPLQWPAGQDILARAVESGQPVQDAHVCQDLSDPSQSTADRAHLAIPIYHTGQSAIGVLALESAFADGFAAAQIDLAARLAGSASLAIRNALCFQEIDRRLQALTAVHQSALRLASCPEPSKLPEAIVRGALDCLHVNRAALYQYDDTSCRWSLAAAMTKSGSHPTHEGPSEKELVQTAARDQTAHTTRDPAGATLIALPLPTNNLRAQTVPIDLELSGILLLALEPSSSPSPTDMDPVHRYADQAAIALRNAGRIVRLEHRSHRRQEHAAFVASQSRAPLTAVQGYARLMLQQIGGGLTGQQHEFLETILRNASQLETLLDKQLDGAPA